MSVTRIAALNTPPVNPLEFHEPRAPGSERSSGPATTAEPVRISIGNKQLELQENGIVKIVDKMNETARIFNNALRFQVNPRSNHVTIQVIDTESGEVVQEIPPEKLVDIFKRMQNTLGLLLDVKA